MKTPHYRTRNWSDYNRSLVQRGSLTLWVDESLIESWRNPRRSGGKGRPERYPKAVILCGLYLRSRYRLPFRATQGFMQSISDLMSLRLKAPDYTLLCKRQSSSQIESLLPNSDKAVTLVIDSTGLKVYGEGEWKCRTHGKTKPRLWRKLHLAVDHQSQMILAHELTERTKQDCQAFPQLLDQIDQPIHECIGDGAYDRLSCYEEATQHQCQLLAPPQRNASTSAKRHEHKYKASPKALAQRDRAVIRCQTIGRAQWKIETLYHRRSIAETAVHRVKSIIGNRLQSRTLINQRAEAAVWCNILNKMTQLGMPITIPVDN